MNKPISATWKRTLYIMFFAQMITMIGFSSIFPFLPLYVESLGSVTRLSTELLAGLAQETCQNRLLLTLEGGYNLFGLKDGVKSVLLALSGRERISPVRLHPSGLLERELAPVFKVMKAFWPGIA